MKKQKGGLWSALLAIFFGHDVVSFRYRKVFQAVLDFPLHLFLVLLFYRQLYGCRVKSDIFQDGCLIAADHNSREHIYQAFSAWH